MKYDQSPWLTTLTQYIVRSSQQRCSIKTWNYKMLLKTSQNSQENTCARVTFLKRRLWHRCFSVNFAKFLRKPFLQNTSGRLLLCSAMSDVQDLGLLKPLALLILRFRFCLRAIARMFKLFST